MEVLWGVLPQTFSTGCVRFVQFSFQCPDLFHDFDQLLFDFLAIWPGVEVVVVHIITLRVGSFGGFH